MASLPLNTKVLSHRFAVPVPGTNSLVYRTFYHGTQLLTFHPLSYSCLSSPGRNLQAVCVSSKLIGNEKKMMSNENVLNPPPSSKEEAIIQVTECLSTLLKKPLKNLGASPMKQKKLKQVRLRVEIPIMDDSPSVLTSLLADVLVGFSVKRKGPPTRIAVFWSNPSVIDLGSQVLRNLENVKSFDLSDAEMGVASVEDWDAIFFVGPGFSQWPAMESIAKEAAPSPVVLFNPNWSAEEEEESDAKGLLSSFETVYSFTALAIQGFFSKTEGAVFRYVKGGSPKGNPWQIFVKDRGEYKYVSSFRKRPDASEIENTLYNLIALNSPVTKSIKFIKGLVSGTNKKK